MTALHDNGWRVDVSLDGLVREDAAAVDVDLIGDSHVVTKDRHVLQTRPLADCRVPANNCRLDPRVVLDLASLEDNTALETYTVADNAVWSDSDVRSDTAVAADLC